MSRLPAPRRSWTGSFWAPIALIRLLARTPTGWSCLRLWKSTLCSTSTCCALPLLTPCLDSDKPYLYLLRLKELKNRKLKTSWIPVGITVAVEVDPDWSIWWSGQAMTALQSPLLNTWRTLRKLLLTSTAVTRISQDHRVVRAPPKEGSATLCSQSGDARYLSETWWVRIGWATHGPPCLIKPAGSKIRFVAPWATSLSIILPIS
jgi:hypothetical protein